MHFIYIIFSEGLNRYNIGETEEISTRMVQHNSGFFNKSSTSIADDWKLLKSFTVNNRIEGRKVETYIKSMKSKIFLNKLIDNPEFYLKFKDLVKEKFEVIIQDGKSLCRRPERSGQSRPTPQNPLNGVF